MNSQEGVAHQGLTRHKRYWRRWMRRTPRVAVVYVLLAGSQLLSRPAADVTPYDLLGPPLGALLLSPFLGLIVALIPPYHSKDNLSGPGPQTGEEDTVGLHEQAQPLIASSPRRERKGKLIVVAITLVAVAVLGDWGLRLAEYQSLITAVESSEQTMESFQGMVRTAGPEVESQPATALALVSTACSYYAPKVSNGTNAVRNVTLVPWHTAILNARSEYVAHAMSWEVYLGACARDIRSYGDPVLSSQISATFAAAKSSVFSAMPVLSPQALDQRVAKIFQN